MLPSAATALICRKDDGRLREIFNFLKFFHRLRGKTLYYMLFFTLCSGFFEVIGVSLFIPILEGADSSSYLGKIFTVIFKALHVQYSFVSVLGVMTLFLFLRSVCLIIAESYIGKVVANLMNDLRIDTAQGIFSAQYPYFLKNDIGYFNNAMTVEFQKLAFAFCMFSSVLSAIILATLYMAVPLFMVPYMSSAFIVAGFPIILVVMRINRLTRHYSQMSSEYSAHLQDVLIQSLNHFKYLKSTQSYAAILEKIHASSVKLGDTFFKQSLFQAVAKNAFIPFVVIIIAVFLFYQVKIESGKVTDVGFVLLLLLGAAFRLLTIQQNYRKFLEAFGSINVFNSLKKGIKEHREDLREDMPSPDFSQDLQLKNVSFAYENNRYVLKNINCNIAAQTTVAFVGASGCGKSTLVTLLTGILKPLKGSISIGGKDYDSVNQRVLRRGIGYVTQESVIFNDTLRNNITLWERGECETKMSSAADKAHLKAFIDASSQGFDTILGANGIKISGGERQRISIARELFKDVKILIFDEATSSLDSQAERTIQQNIDEFRGEKTIILVTHRLVTVRNSDMIFVLKDGQIVEQGTYDELYALNGEFRHMLDLQKTMKENS